MKTYKLYNDDCFDVMSKFDDNSIDCIITDPPYFLSNDGITVRVVRWFQLTKEHGM